MGKYPNQASLRQPCTVPYCRRFNTTAHASHSRNNCSYRSLLLANARRLPLPACFCYTMMLQDTPHKARPIPSPNPPRSPSCAAPRLCVHDYSRGSSPVSPTRDPAKNSPVKEALRRPSQSVPHCIARGFVDGEPLAQATLPRSRVQSGAENPCYAIPMGRYSRLTLMKTTSLVVIGLIRSDNLPCLLMFPRQTYVNVLFSGLLIIAPFSD